jgi:Arc/MetJ family transcription regulator
VARTWPAAQRRAEASPTTVRRRIYAVVAVLSDTTKLAYELSRSAVYDQAHRLGDLRTRAGTLLAAASIAGSFLGVTKGTIDTLAVLALVAYVSSVAAAIYTLMPHTLKTEFRGSSLLQASREVEATDDETYEATVQWLETVRDENADVLDKLTKWYVASAAALGVEVVLWSVALTT